MTERSKLTPPQLAKRWGVSDEKVLNLIRDGELRAINVSSGTQRARYLIDEVDIADFEKRRATRPLPDVSVSRPRQSGGQFV